MSETADIEVISNLMVLPSAITNYNNLIPQGRGFIEIRKDRFVLKKPVQIPLFTRRNVKEYGAKFMRRVKHLDQNRVYYKRSLLELEPNAISGAKIMKENGLLTEEQENEFKALKGNLNRFKYLYSITNFRFII